MYFSLFRDNKGSVSLSIPRCDFVAVTRPSDAQRMYVKFKSNLKPIVQDSKRMTKTLLIGYDELKKEAEKIVSLCCIYFLKHTK